MEALLSEYVGIKQVAVPQDINGTALSGDRVHAGKCHKIAILVEADAGAGDIDFSMEQHNAASAGTSKALPIKYHYIKQDAETKYSKVESADAANIALGVGGVKCSLVVEVLCEDLDRDGGFDYISLNIASPGANAKVVSGSYLLHQVRQKPAYELDL